MMADLVSRLETELQIILSEDVKLKLEDEGLTFESFKLLSEDDLKELGFKMGARKLALEWIQAQRSCGASSCLPVTTPTPVSSSLTHTTPTSCASTMQTALLEPIEDTLRKYQKPQLAVNGASLVEKLKSGSYYSTSERIFFVKVLARHLMKTCAKPDFPTPDEKTDLAKRIIATFPVLRNEKTPNGYETFYDRVSHSGYLESYIRNKRSRDQEITTRWTHKKQSFTVTPGSNDDERMLREMRPTSSNTAEILELMVTTRGVRRDWIKHDKPTITAILKRYPRLQDMNKALQMEFEAIIPEDARTAQLRVQWQNLRTKVLDVARTKAETQPELQRLLNSVENEYDEEKLTEVSFRALPHLLPVPPQRTKKTPKVQVNVAEKMLFFEAQEDTPDYAAKQSSATLQPTLFRCQGRLWLKADHTPIEITDAGCFADAIQILMSSFWIFNVEYPYHLKPVYDLLEAILKLKTIPKTVVAREMLRRLES